MRLNLRQITCFRAGLLKDLESYQPDQGERTDRGLGRLEDQYIRVSISTQLSFLEALRRVCEAPSNAISLCELRNGKTSPDPVRIGAKDQPCIVLR